MFILALILFILYWTLVVIWGTIVFVFSRMVEGNSPLKSLWSGVWMGHLWFITIPYVFLKGK